jgi:hypothetical protein
MSVIQTQRGTAAALTATNPVIADGQIVYETDTRRFKVGDGSTAWNSLSYATPAVSHTHAASDLTSGTLADARLSANVVLTTDTRLANVVSSPSQINANQNDYAVGTGDIFRISSDAARTITGIVAGTSGATILLVNVGSFAITLSHQSSSSTAANRIIVPWAGDCTIAASAALSLYYDGTTSRWRVL